MNTCIVVSILLPRETGISEGTIKILANRQDVYQEAKLKNPERWSGNTRNWNPATKVVFKKFKRVKQSSEKIKKAA